MTYNLTELQQAGDASSLLSYANDATGGFLVLLFVFAFFFIALMVTMRAGFAEALMTSGFLSFVLAGIFAFGGTVNILIPLFFLALMAFSGMYLYVVKR